MTKQEALAESLGISVEKAEILIRKERYLVLTEREAQEESRKEITSHMGYYFSPATLVSACGLDKFFVDILDVYMETGNDEILYRMVEKYCGINEFVDFAIEKYGRGYFLSPSEMSEVKSGGYFIYDASWAIEE